MGDVTTTYAWPRLAGVRTYTAGHFVRTFENFPRAFLIQVTQQGRPPVMGSSSAVEL